MRAGLPLLVILPLAGCYGDPVHLNVAPCYARHRAVDLDHVSEIGITPRDAVGRYAAVFEDEDGQQQTVDVRLHHPVTGWVREVIREPAFGFEETPACDVRVGIELEVELETGDGLFVEHVYGAAFRTEFQDAWVVRMVRPLNALEGDYPEERPEDGCPNVNVGFDLDLDQAATGGRIVENAPGTTDEDGPCFREILSWER